MNLTKYALCVAVPFGAFTLIIAGADLIPLVANFGMSIFGAVAAAGTMLVPGAPIETGFASCIFLIALISALLCISGKADADAIQLMDPGFDKEKYLEEHTREDMERHLRGLRVNSAESYFFNRLSFWTDLAVYPAALAYILCVCAYGQAFYETGEISEPLGFLTFMLMMIGLCLVFLMIELVCNLPRHLKQERARISEYKKPAA